MNKLNYSRKHFVKNRDISRAKVNLCREKFKDLERQRKMDSKKASRICKKLSERFKWWQSLP